jgi:hypothetical protein
MPLGPLQSMASVAPAFIWTAPVLSCADEDGGGPLTMLGETAMSRRGRELGVSKNENLGARGRWEIVE